MKSEELNQLNIDNLTSLWRKMGVNNNSGLDVDGLTVSALWPHRYWFDWSANTQQVNAIVPVLHQLPMTAVVPVWAGGGEPARYLETYLKDECFQVLFSQTAMYLHLESQINPEVSDATIQKVQSSSDLETWVATASAAFGYRIDLAAIAPLIDLSPARLLWLESAGKAVATALVYQTGEVIGVHLVGVPSEHRGQGFARMMMQYVISLSVRMGGKYLTLQASPAGEPLYRELGFVEQFAIKNYQRKRE